MGRKKEITLYQLVNTPNGNRYARMVKAARGWAQAKPLEGEPGSYYLRLHKNGKPTFESVGKDLANAENGKPTRKYSFLFHTEQARKSHDWQEQVVTAIRDQLVDAAQKNNARLDAILRASYDDLKRSMTLGGEAIPDFGPCSAAVRKARADGFLTITKVNSDKDVEELVDDKGQLKLRTPMNMYIGGQILDRGITIANLIGFYYGRNPQKFQQDTVLQHSRMYGCVLRRIGASQGFTLHGISIR